MKDKKRGVFYHKNGHIDLVKTFHGDNPSLSKKGKSNIALKINEYSSTKLKENYLKILITMLPIIPHYSSECIKLINSSLDVKWPDIDNKILIQKNINYVVQINGKTRQIISEKSDLSEIELMDLIKKDKSANKYIKSEANIKRIIFIPNKLINIIVG